ncbi:MAG: tRNA preQ1(34) S-adenosylmethionine ribosyltransferase-isomerase QueA [Proteobacteria bacterium]|nr:tRNA preQ1(34) S-adenosylmethionine ribosyltransferase-isomerase QueA [Pseudomonadota bacterium]MCL2309096.1 tRNA preQ1(34) S-adenosylmethionine ribosyltransferase-isomerase QueA [Pseudomonadota bacterium]
MTLSDQPRRRSYTRSDFEFDLPPTLIAQYPLPERTASRLLHVVPKENNAPMLTDMTFKDLPRLIAPGDLLVFNDTKVIKARLFGKKAGSGGRVELLIERLTGDDSALVQMRASHMPNVGTVIALDGARATVLGRQDRFFEVRFEGTGDLVSWLNEHGQMPLPPYIRRTAEDMDDARYQTVYARAPGAVAAPTAGLHFDEALLATLDAQGVRQATVTLHVGAGTFQPVQHEDLSRHVMHREMYEISAETAATIAAARVHGGRIVAVGTTSLRALESAADDTGALHVGRGETALFITPGYRFKVVDCLLTNFHLPGSTLLMLVAAFAGYETMRAAYAHAVAAQYRFFSYGDAMLLEKASLPLQGGKIPSPSRGGLGRGWGNRNGAPASFSPLPPLPQGERRKS